MIFEQFLELDRFTASEKNIIEFIQEHPDIAVKLSLEELANACYVSQASIIRFCKKLNTKGFSDFKVSMAKELNSFIMKDQNISVDVPIRENASFHEIADTFFSLSQHALENTRNLLKAEDMMKAANMIHLADIVHIYGRGESLILAEDFQYKLTRIGKHVHLDPLNGFTENHNMSLPSPKLKECALVITQYCNSRQIRFIIDELVGSGIPFVLLTAAEKIWPYDKYASVVLHIDCKESRNKMGCFESRTAFLYVLDCLYGLVFSKNYEKNTKHLIDCAARKAEHDYYYTFMK